MKNTWLAAIISIALILAFVITETHALSSKTRVRLYRKTLHEIIEKNGAFIADFASMELGSTQIGDKNIDDTLISIAPHGDENEELETELKFIEGTGIELTLNDFKINIKGKVEDKDLEINGDIESIFFRVVAKQKKEEIKSKSTLFDFSSIPQFDIDDHKIKFNENSIKWTLSGHQLDDPNLTLQTVEWLNLSIKVQLNALKILFNASQQRLASYISEKLATSGEHAHSLSLSGVDFFEDYVEVSVESNVAVAEADESMFRTSEEGVKQAGDKINALEVVIDENLVNFWIYSLFQDDNSIGLRKTLRVDDRTNEYASVFDNILMTQVVSQAWNELDAEFGADKKIDAQCSFGKSLFKNQIKDIKSPKINFLKNSKLDLTLGFGCSIIVESEPGKWENFRSFYGELYAMIQLIIKPNDATKTIHLSGHVEDLKALRIKIFKQSTPMVAEEMTLAMMINIGLGMLKQYADKALEVPHIGYPNIKECTGLTVLRPSINIYNRYIVFSFDLGVKAAEKGCDLLTDPKVERIQAEKNEDLNSEDLDQINEDL